MNDAPEILQELDLILSANETRAQIKWLCKLLDHAGSRLYFAREVRSHNVAREQALDAADALYLAAKIADLPRDEELLRLSARVYEMLRYIGHPSGDELEAVAEAVKEIRRSCPMV